MMAISSHFFRAYLHKTVSAAPLAVFRILFGGMILAGIVRFWLKGWIADLYIKPVFFFSYYGFEWIKPLGQYTYFLFAICALSAVLVMLGYYYRLAIISLFISFTYIELIDKSTYLNHYYFVSLLCFLLVFLPANAFFSVDAWRRKQHIAFIPAWCIDALKLMVGILYLYAGLAKINDYWLLEAQPLRIWLPAYNDTPLVGGLFNHIWVAYLFSWFACLYDCSIPFLLFFKRSRWVGYGLVIVFHALTAVLFPIGMFPYVMMVTALVFFSGRFHLQLVDFMRNCLPYTQKNDSLPSFNYVYPSFVRNAVLVVFALFFMLQLLLPWRYLAYPGNVFWTEEGYRFSWRVMLMEKAGYAQFTVIDTEGKRYYVSNTELLTPLQEKMMSTQPDMIVQYAHFLKQYYCAKGYHAPQVFADVYVSFNGRLSRQLINPATDLAKEQDSWAPKKWILSVDETSMLSINSRDDEN